MGFVCKVRKPKVRATTILINAMGTNKAPGALMLTAQKSARRIAGEMAQEMRDSIYQDRYLKPPLSPRYLQWKRKKGLDPRKLIATKKYVQAITAVKTPFGAIVGIKKGFRMDKGRKLEYWKLQRWLECGTRKRLASGKMGSLMPARPHWRPMMRYWKTNRKRYGLRIKREMGSKLREILKPFTKG